MASPRRKPYASSAVAVKELPRGVSWVDPAKLKYGWIAPDGSALDTGPIDHEDVIECLGLGYDEALKAGWLRVAGFLCYELDSSREEAMDNLNARLKRLYVEGRLEDSRGDSVKVYLDTFHVQPDARTSYVFEKKHFRRQLFDVRNLLDKQYEVH